VTNFAAMIVTFVGSAGGSDGTSVDVSDVQYGLGSWVLMRSLV
jgi:hypothetical protein